MKYSTAELNAIIKSQSSSEIGRLIAEYIHDTRNREIARQKLINNVAYEPLSEAFGITPRHCFNIVRTAKEIIVEHIKG